MQQQEGRQGPEGAPRLQPQAMRWAWGARKDGAAGGGMGLVLGTNSDAVTQEEEQVDVVVVGGYVLWGAGNERALATWGWGWGEGGGGGGGGAVVQVQQET